MSMRPIGSGRFRMRYLITIAILLLVGLFIALSWCIAPIDQCLAFDSALHQALINQSPRGFRAVMRFGHWLSDLAVLLAPLLVAWLAIRRRIRLAVIVCLSEAGAYVLQLLLKGVFQRTRPGDIVLPGASSSVYLFPSGHTVAAIVTVGLAAYLIADGRSQTVRRLIVAGAALFIALAVMSLVYFGNHYATDVIGGLLIGGAWLLGALQIVRLARAPLYEARHAQAGPDDNRAASGR